MAKSKKIVIKEGEISNHCPVCYNKKLKITFYQKHTFNAFYHKTTDEVTHEIKCKKCYSIIYPVDWTDDIERVYEYYNKLVVPERSSLRFTTLFFVLILLVLGLIGGGIYLYLEGFI